MLQQALERRRGLTLQRLGVAQIFLAYAHAVHDDKVGLGWSVRGDRLQFVLVDDSDTTPLHLLEVDPALHGTHEHDDLDRLDVGTGRDHVHCDGNPRVEAVSEVLNEIRGLLTRHLIGDLLGEVVAATELFAHDLEDVFRVAVVLGEDEGLGHLATARKDIREEPVSERANDEPDLVPGDDLPVEIIRVVGDILVRPFPSDRSGLTVPNADHGLGTGLNGRALLGDVRADAVDLEVDVYAIGDRLLVAILHDEILVEKAEGLF